MRNPFPATKKFQASVFLMFFFNVGNANYLNIIQQATIFSDDVGVCYGFLSPAPAQDTPRMALENNIQILISMLAASALDTCMSG
jgi:hypothetical protein